MGQTWEGRRGSVGDKAWVWPQASHRVAALVPVAVGIAVKVTQWSRARAVLAARLHCTVKG